MGDFKAGRWSYSEEELQDMFAKADEAGARADATEPRAVSARYDKETGRIVVILRNGWEFGFYPWMAQGLQDATPEQLAEVEVIARGSGLQWESLDAHLGIVGLLAGRYGSEKHMERLSAKMTKRSE